MWEYSLQEESGSDVDEDNLDVRKEKELAH